MGDLIGWLRSHPAQALPQLAPGGARMLARTPTASAAMMAAHPSGRIVGVPGEEFSGMHLGAVPGQPPVAMAVPAGGQPPVLMGTAVPMGQPP